MFKFYAALVLLFVIISIPVLAQENNTNTVKVIIKNEETKEPVAGATVTVKGTEITATTDASGKAELSGFPNKAQTIEVFSAGYETKELILTFPPAGKLMMCQPGLRQ
jgi:iron complex outermembrane receptor protein